MSDSPAALRYRGVNYDTGTLYVPDEDSRPDWSTALVRRQLGTIRDELHANAVNLFGSHVDRLVEATRVGLALGLDVWVQPRLPDAGPARTANLVATVAEAIEAMRADGGAVRLNVGCELTIFATGLIPGRGFERRARRLRWLWPAMPIFNRRLDRLLRLLAATARDRFCGEITYGAGTWETVSWDPFDAVGLNQYRDASNHHRYATTLALARCHGKPVLVTEFGCCSYPGADARGAEGDAVVDWTAPDRPAVIGHHPRDEAVQATYLGELLDIFAATGIDGAFVFEYTEPTYPRHDDPRHDIDVGSFGLVAVEITQTADGTRYHETPKAGFHAVADRYRGAALWS
jgi:hypothetical protein